MPIPTKQTQSKRISPRGSGGGGSRGSSNRYVPRGGPQYGKIKPIAKPDPVAPASPNPMTRASEQLITNSGGYTGDGGTVATENRAGGFRRRAKNTAFASQELLG